MSLPSRIAEFGWFGAGWAVCKGGTDDPDVYPPIDDCEALYHWLAGFGTTWVECPEGEAMESILNGDGLGKDISGRGGVGAHAGDPAGPSVWPVGVRFTSSYTEWLCVPGAECPWRLCFPHSPKKTESSALILIGPDRVLWLLGSCFVAVLLTPLGDLLDLGLAVGIGRYAGATHPTQP